MRWLHPWIGVVLFVASLVLFVRFLKANLLERGEAELAGTVSRRPIGSRGEPAGGRQVQCRAEVRLLDHVAPVLVLILTGIAIWDQYFYDWTTILQKRAAVLAHALFAIGMITVWIVHAYAAVWVRGTIQRHDARLCHRRLGVAAPSQVAARARRRPSQERDTGKPRGVGLRAGGRCAAVSAGKVPRDRCGS